MLVKFKVNLGSNDARPLGLDFSRCMAGMTLEVPDNVGDLLIAKGLASETVLEAVAKPAAIQGVPDESKPAPLAARVKQSQSSKES